MPERVGLSDDPVSRLPLRTRLAGERGQGLVELLAALALLAVAVSALIAAYASSVVSIEHTGAEGTATTLADRQIEVYRTLPFACIALNSGTPPTGCPTYAGFPNPYSADQTAAASSSPDHRAYAVHVDITYATADHLEKSVSVTVSDAAGQARASQSSLFSQAAFPTSG